MPHPSRKDSFSVLIKPKKFHFSKKKFLQIRLRISSEKRKNSIPLHFNVISSTTDDYKYLDPPTYLYRGDSLATCGTLGSIHSAK
jgi:hypothetical protein